MKKVFALLFSLCLLFVICAGTMPRNKEKKHAHDFTLDQMKDHLAESMGELPAFTRRKYTLDYISIDYSMPEERMTIDKVEFGFSLYLEFDLYSAVCVELSDKNLKSSHIIEEAKSIYDDFYESKAPVGNLTSEQLKSFVHNSTLSVWELVERIIQSNLNCDVYDISVNIDREQNMVVFS